MIQDQLNTLHDTVFEVHHVMTTKKHNRQRSTSRTRYNYD